MLLLLLLLLLWLGWGKIDARHPPPMQHATTATATSRHAGVGRIVIHIVIHTPVVMQTMTMLTAGRTPINAAAAAAAVVVATETVAVTNGGKMAVAAATADVVPDLSQARVVLAWESGGSVLNGGACADALLYERSHG